MINNYPNYRNQYGNLDKNSTLSVLHTVKIVVLNCLEYAFTVQHRYQWRIP